MKKRMLSVVLTLCLMLGMVPAVYAEDTSGLQSLIDNATTAEITLNQNYVITDTVTINKDLTIHGNNHSITYSGSASAINVTATSGAAVTLENVSILAESNGAYAINLTSTQPDLTLDNVTIRADTRGVNMYPSGGCTNGKLTIESSHIYNSRISDYNTNAVLGDTRAIAMSEVKNSDITLTDSELMGFGYSINITGANGSNDINSITVRVSDAVNSQVAEESIENILTALHGKKDFFMINSDSIKQTIENTTNTMKLLIASIAVISLIVGGIGVMNIMLVSVTERTKEIGIRMAIGAKQRDILQQFLIEAVLICIAGGFMGVTLSMLIGLGFNTFSTNFGMDFSTTSIVLALVCSTSIGIIFGYMPAKNASNLNPIDALASE